MDEWFTNVANSNPRNGKPDTTTVTTSWVKSFPRVKSIYDQMLLDTVWIHEHAQTEIAILLKRLGKLLPIRSTFGNLSHPVTTLDANSIQFVRVGSLAQSATATIDHLTAALNRFTFKFVIAGSVRPGVRSNTPIHTVEIDEVGIYVRDSYDFNDDPWWEQPFSQPLGCWDPGNNSVSKVGSSNSHCVNNETFRNWRAQSAGYGGDFLIFSDLERLPRVPPDTIEIPPKP
jgi:hypothetical protein